MGAVPIKTESRDPRLEWVVETVFTMELVPADSRLDDVCQHLGIGNILEVERPGDCGERRKPARERRCRFARRGACDHGNDTCRGTAAICVTDDENYTLGCMREQEFSPAKNGDIAWVWKRCVLRSTLGPATACVITESSTLS
jgi:hypothetical protein